MKLLFDQNISHRIVKKIEPLFPDSKQVNELNLENSSDIEIWKYAFKENYTIVTFDSDFIDISVLKGFPPKIIWLRFGNTSTDNIAKKLLNEKSVIENFINNINEAYLELNR